jgi:adenylate cyclase
VTSQAEGGTTKAPLRRRLAAVMCADIAGYSRLMHEDEAATHEAFRTHWDSIVLPAVESFGGRVVKSTGDGFVAEFPSVVSAVECAIRIQTDLAVLNEATPPNRRLRFRIGVTIGEIIIEENDIYGDRVNVAARIQEQARVGGICISAAAHDEVKGRIAADFQNLGQRKVKNIAKPIQLYDVVWPTTLPEARVRPRSFWRRHIVRIKPIPTLAAIAASVVLAGAFTLTYYDWWRIDTASATRDADGSVPQSDKPAIAVLAFDNLGAGRTDSYFGDGIAEDITTELSRQQGMRVIARNSSFAYKGSQKSIREIGRELGVQYVLEGSIQREGNRLRINAQLVDVTSDMHVWADRYDRRVDDIFDIQDDITRRVVSALSLKLVGQPMSARPERTRSVRAYDLYMNALSHLHKVTAQDTVEAVSLLKAAIIVDPNYARADAALAWAYLLVMRFNWHHELGLKTRYDAYDLAWKQVEKALRAPSALAYRVRAELNFREGLYERVVEDIARARALAPNDAAAIALLGRVRVKMGRHEEAIELLRQAVRLDPNQPLYQAWLGVAEFARGDYAAAASSIERAEQRKLADYTTLDHLVAADAYLGKLDKARAELAKLNALRSSVGAEPYTLFLAARSAHYGNDCDLSRLIQGLRMAGVPAGPKLQPTIDLTGCAAGTPRKIPGGSSGG